MASKKKKEEQLPDAIEVLKSLMTHGTVWKYLAKEIVFKNSRQSAVKSLKVNILSTETLDMAVLHKLHTQTRGV